MKIDGIRKGFWEPLNNQIKKKETKYNTEGTKRARNLVIGVAIITTILLVVVEHRIEYLIWIVPGFVLTVVCGFFEGYYLDVYGGRNWGSGSFFILTIIALFILVSFTKGTPAETVVLASLLIGMFSGFGIYAQIVYQHISKIPLEHQRSELPINGDDLWPKGQLIQLRGFDPSMTKSPVKYSPILILTKEGLIIGEEKGMEDVIEQLEHYPKAGTPSESAFDSSTPYQGEVTDYLLFRPSNIERIELSSHNARFPLIEIWVRNEKGKVELLFKTFNAHTPKTMTKLAEKAIEQGLLDPTRLYWEAKNILVKEMERQFRRIAIQAVITIKGTIMSEEDFRKLVR